MLTVAALGIKPQSKLNGFISLHFANQLLMILENAYPNNQLLCNAKLFEAVSFCLKMLLDDTYSCIESFELTILGEDFRQQRAHIIHNLNSMHSLNKFEYAEVIRGIKNTVYNMAYRNGKDDIAENIEDIMSSYVYIKYLLYNSKLHYCLPKNKYFRKTMSPEKPTAYEGHRHIYDKYIHQELLSILPWILEYKIQNEEPFHDIEVIWDFLNEEQYNLAIFNLDILTRRDTT